MADDEKEEKKGEGFSAGLSNGIIFAVVGAIIGVLLSVFALIDAGFGGMSSLLVLGLGGAGIGFALGFMYGAFPKNMKFIAVLIIIICVVLLAYWLFISAKFGAGPLGNIMKPMGLRIEKVGGAFSSFKSYTYCFSNDPRCPFIAIWEKPTVQNSQERLSVAVEFSDKKIINNEINLQVSLKVKNPELDELEIVPKCYFKSEKTGEELEIVQLGSYSYGSKFVFPKSGNEMSTSFRCRGSVDDTSIISEKVIVVLERPTHVETTWPIKVRETEGNYQGQARSIMSFSAPFSVALASSNEIPFAEGKEYSFSIIIRREDSNVKFKKLNSLVLNVPKDLLVECTGMEGYQLDNIDYEQLKTIMHYDSSIEKFSMPCTLYVQEASATETLLPIQAITDYTIESAYEIIVTK